MDVPQMWLSLMPKSVQCIINSLDTVREIGKLVKKSSQRNTKLDKIYKSRGKND